MIKNLFKNYIYPISVFSGGVIGVGFLSLPYVAMQSGIWSMIGYFIVLTVIIVVINLIFCDISLKTPDFKRFPGFVGYYLGKKMQAVTMTLIILGAIGVLLAYLLVGTQFLTAVFGSSGNSLIFALIYFVIVSTIIYFDIKVVSKVEFFILVLLFLSIVLVFINSFSQIKLGNIFMGGQDVGVKSLFLPYGPLLFALWGVGLIPEVEEMIRGSKKRLKTIITISTILISIFYFLFTILILGITGKQTDPTALTGLKLFLGGNLIYITLLMGALASIMAFITQGLLLKKTLIFDLKIKHWQAFTIACCPPLILFLMGFTSFIPLLSFIGAVLIGIDGILILLMYKKIGGKNIIIYSLFLIFLLGVIYEITYFIS
jgi:amino acid permease